MLILSRKVGEKIAIGDDVTIVVNRISGNRVALGIHAPKHVRVVRGELERFADELEDDQEERSPVPAGPIATLVLDDTTASAFMPRNAR